jgi:hypothetical protein
MSVGTLMYQFTQIIIGEILIIFKKNFSSTVEAQKWNEKTKICLNFTLMTAEQISAWEGDKIYIPLNSKRKRKNGNANG